jgi:class 3 adenylate cyclase
MGTIHEALQALLPWKRALGGARLRELTVMYTDMAGSTAFAAVHGAAALLAKTTKHNELVLPLVEEHGGTVLRVIGDATQSIFDDPCDGARCAVALQRRLAAYNEVGPVDVPDLEIHVRVGLHHGKAILYRFRGQLELVGNAPNVGARVESSGGKRTDEVLISEAVAVRLRAHPDEFHTEPLGPVEAKGVGPLNVYRLLWKDAPAPRGPAVLSARAVELPAGPEAEGNARAVHCIFIDERSGRGHLVPVWVRVQLGAAPDVRGRTPCDVVMTAAARRAAAAAFLVLEQLGFEEVLPGRQAVEWWVAGPEGLRYEGPSLGLGVALATVAAYTGTRIDPRVAATGAVADLDVIPVAGVAGKWRALRDANRFRALVLPSDNLNDLPPEARSDPGLRLVEVPTVPAAVLDVLGPALGLAAGRLAALDRPAPPAEIRLWVQPAGDDLPAGAPAPGLESGERTWFAGDRVRVCARVNADCHLALAHVNAAGEVQVLRPNTPGAPTAVRADQLVTFPGPADAFDFELPGPPGRARLTAIASASPLPLRPEDFGPPSPWGGARPGTRGVGLLAGELEGGVLARREVELYVSERREAAVAVRTRGARPSAEEEYAHLDLG